MKKSITLLILFATTFLFSQQALALTYNVTVPAGTEACWIVGDMTGWSFKNRMTKVDATHFTLDKNLALLSNFKQQADEVGNLCLQITITDETIYRDWETDRKSTRLNSSHITRSRMPSSA